MENDVLIELFCNFINDIGIDTIENNTANSSFLPGIEIENGKLLFCRNKLVAPGDLLHEAGHIALTTPSERKLLNGNILKNNPQKEGEELAVMLWTFAACIKLKVPGETVFHIKGYKGDSDWILNSYKNKNYLGLPLLIWMGMAHAPELENGFPAMRKWLRD